MTLTTTTTTTPAEKTVSELEAEIAAQTIIFHDLRAQGAPLDEAKKQLSDLKKQLSDLKKALGLVKGSAGKEKGEKGEETDQPQAGEQPKKKERLLLKTAKVPNFFLLSVIMY